MLHWGPKLGFRSFPQLKARMQDAELAFLLNGLSKHLAFLRTLLRFCERLARSQVDFLLLTFRGPWEGCSHTLAMGSLPRLVSIRQSSAQSLGTALRIAVHPEGNHTNWRQKTRSTIYTIRSHAVFPEEFYLTVYLKSLVSCMFCVLEDLLGIKHMYYSAIIVMQHDKKDRRGRNGMRPTSWGLLYLNGLCCQQQQWKMDDWTVTSSGNRLIDGLSDWRFLIHSSCMSAISLLQALLIHTHQAIKLSFTRMCN